MITKHQKSGNIIRQIRDKWCFLPEIKGNICDSDLISWYLYLYVYIWSWKLLIFPRLTLKPFFPESHALIFASPLPSAIAFNNPCPSGVVIFHIDHWPWGQRSSCWWRLSTHSSRFSLTLGSASLCSLFHPSMNIHGHLLFMRHCSRAWHWDVNKEDTIPSLMRQAE